MRGNEKVPDDAVQVLQCCLMAAVWQLFYFSALFGVSKPVTKNESDLTSNSWIYEFYARAAARFLVAHQQRSYPLEAGQISRFV